MSHFGFLGTTTAHFWVKTDVQTVVGHESCVMAKNVCKLFLFFKSQLEICFPKRENDSKRIKSVASGNQKKRLKLKFV